MNTARLAVADGHRRSRLSRTCLVLFAACLALLTYGTEARAATVNVAAGSNLQSAIDAAQPGDTLMLEAGATFLGPITLPNKPGADWITIRTAAPDASLPAAGVRITPAYASVLPKIISPGHGEAALRTAPRAHHYRFIGIEIGRVNANALVYDLVQLGDAGAGQSTLDSVPHHLVIDRCYIHGDTGGLKRGIALNSAHTEILNSYISDFKQRGQEAQAIGGWNGPGPFKIINNYVEGAGENILIGGADPSIPNLVPSDIEIRRNHLYKPPAWRGVWTVKNIFEIKSARRVTVDGNLFENNWTDAQNGYAILFTVRNQDGGAPWSVIEDLQFTNNIVRHTGSGINILGKDYINPSLQSARILVKNNLFEDVNGQTWSGQGNFLILANGFDVRVENNTVFHTGNVTTANGTPSPNYVFRNNLLAHNDYGVIGDGMGYGLPTINAFFPGAAFERNVIAGGPDYKYPSNNFFPASLNDVGFVDRAGGNYRLGNGSSYKNAGTDGKDIGCDFDALAAAMSNDALPTPTPTPTPTPCTDTRTDARTDAKSLDAHLPADGRRGAGERRRAGEHGGRVRRANRRAGIQRHAGLRRVSARSLSLRVTRPDRCRTACRALLHARGSRARIGADFGADCAGTIAKRRVASSTGATVDAGRLSVSGSQCNRDERRRRGQRAFERHARANARAFEPRNHP